MEPFLAEPKNHPTQFCKRHTCETGDAGDVAGDAGGDAGDAGGVAGAFFKTKIH